MIAIAAVSHPHVSQRPNNIRGKAPGCSRVELKLIPGVQKRRTARGLLEMKAQGSFHRRIDRKGPPAVKVRFMNARDALSQHRPGGKCAHQDTSPGKKYHASNKFRGFRLSRQFVARLSSI